MITEALQTLRSFGCSPGSAASPEEIALREKKLKITLPEGLRDLYLTFSPQDPIFSDALSLVPLEELKLRRVKNVHFHYTVLPFLRSGPWGLTYAVGVEQKAGPGHSNSNYLENFQLLQDPPVFRFYENPPERSMRGMQRPDGGGGLSALIVELLALRQIFALPEVLSVSCRNLTEQDSFLSLSRLQPLHGGTKAVFVPQEAPYALLAGLCHYPGLLPDSFTRAEKGYYYRFFIGACTGEPLEALAERIPFLVQWQRRQGKDAASPQEQVSGQERAAPPPSEGRELYSIAPVLSFLCKFSGADGPAATEESIEKAEARLGGALPLPLKEFYQYLPKACCRGHNTILPPGSLRRRQDGKITFLTGAQQTFYCAAALNSPFVFQRLDGPKAEWTPTGILDGYLAAEFAMDLGCGGKPGLSFDTYPDFRMELLQENGALRPHLSNIAGLTDKIAAGNCVRLYQGMGERLVAVCESTTPALYLIARDWETIRAFLAAVRAHG